MPLDRRGPHRDGENDVPIPEGFEPQSPSPNNQANNFPTLPDKAKCLRENLERLDCPRESESRSKQHSKLSLRHSSKQHSETFWRNIVERAEQMELPHEALRFAHPLVRQLVRICLALQENAVKEPFYFSSYIAADLLGINQRLAHRWLSTLCDSGILTLVKSGDRLLANRYRMM